MPTQGIPSQVRKGVLPKEAVRALSPSRGDRDSALLFWLLSSLWVLFSVSTYYFTLLWLSLLLWNNTSQLTWHLELFNLVPLDPVCVFRSPKASASQANESFSVAVTATSICFCREALTQRHCVLTWRWIADILLKGNSWISRVNKIPLNKAFQLVKFRTRKKPDLRIFSGFEPRVFFLLEWIWYIFIHVELLPSSILFWDGRSTMIALVLNPMDAFQLLSYLTSQ